MKIAIGCDHGGFELKNEIIEYLKSEKHEVKDFGTHSTDSCDYPDIALPVAEAVAAKEFEFGILICGSELLYFGLRPNSTQYSQFESFT